MLEHFEIISNFSYCTHSSVYRVFGPSGRVVDCNTFILFRHFTTGPEHHIYIAHTYVYSMKSLNTFQNALFSDFKVCAH